MKKYVLLMRHAKSSWDDDSLKDFDRPLNKRGEKDAPRMASFLKETGYLPDYIISSPARRTAKTVSHILKPSKRAGEPVWDEQLYHGSGEAYMNALRKAPAEAECLMLVGHNPMTENTAEYLAGTERDAIKMPTAAVVCFQTDIENWEQFGPGRAMLKWMMIPKLLKSL